MLQCVIEQVKGHSTGSVLFSHTSEHVEVTSHLANILVIFFHKFLLKEVHHLEEKLGQLCTALDIYSVYIIVLIFE